MAVAAAGLSSHRVAGPRRRRLLVGLFQLLFLIAFHICVWGVWRYVLPGATLRWRAWPTLTAAGSADDRTVMGVAPLPRREWSEGLGATTPSQPPRWRSALAAARGRQTHTVTATADNEAAVAALLRSAAACSLEEPAPVEERSEKDAGAIHHGSTSGRRRSALDAR